MSGEPSALEISIGEILTKIMADRQFSIGIQASPTGELQAFSSTGCHSSRVNPTIEKRSKHHDELANVKHVSSFLPDYIPPLAGAVNRDSIPHDFEYTLITAYIPKGICVVGTQLGQIPALKNNDFNLDNIKNYAMLTPHKYLMKTTRKKPRIVSQLWIRELAHSTILNVMKIPHFG
jgi:hypothetical protein